MRSALAIVLMFAATQLAAQDIGYKMESIKAGSTITFKNFDDMVDHHVFMGKVGEHYVFKTYDGATDAQPWSATNYVTENGEMVRIERAGGQWITFTPHNCIRTVGLCSFVQKSNTHRPKHFNRFTEVSGDTLTFSVTYQRGKVDYTGSGQMGLHNWPTQVNIRWNSGREATQKTIRTDFK